MKRVLALALLVISFAASAAPRPNIVFILADDLGYGDLSCYGAPDIKTPNLDRLATQGVRFTDFYANGCVCTPTRCALMTGRYQQHIGGLETAIPAGGKNLGLPSQEKTIADFLHTAGYTTAMSGKWHLGYKPETMPNAHGFDHFFGLVSGNHDYFTHKENNGEADLYLEGKPIEMEGYSTHLITDHALKFLEKIKSKPFFLYVPFNAPHFPAEGPDDQEMKPDAHHWNQGTRKTYVKMVEEMDRGIGKILAALETNNLSSNTLVIFESDNGGATLSRNAPLNKGKASLWEGGIRVPCIARFPNKIPAGTETHQVGITMDWTATIAKLAGAKPPKDRPFEGIDLLPIISGKQKNIERTLFWRSVNFSFVKLFRAVRDGDWKYIESYKGDQPFLYNLAQDIGETKNVVAENPKLAINLKKKLDQWESEIDPPLYPAEPAVKLK
ncbi:MAG: atsA 9 [Verrucomicrobiales bacterium]|nr:atsA 9 [Verrucomicrobiales bacterium]